ncbi:GNAT family N-acetyltransferase [Nocardiopsis flavescens]|uniref:Acetyltransferase (GNAT) family protein n=1 Tax=Nocardiopsis flavescens TaxID=758803 RepID=A0A1M6SY67_9ACTN|nr:GNAT family N-acetyltransferase [Nocardiopsis flavescens]SHK49643.1 Acetyltransferase (GNAT) family protein [Nocardiopsis flavescens]
MSAVSELRVIAYTADGLLEADPAYVEALRLLGADGHGEVLVAEDGDRLLGTIMFEPWSERSEIARGADEAEVRAFAVAPHGRGRGVGRALVNALVELAREEGVSRLLLSTQEQMLSAQYVYRARGFVRVPERDRSPLPGVTLETYELVLKE